MRASLTVSLVIPGRNCESTLSKCLKSVVPLLKQKELQKIIFVDDRSTDRSATIAAGFSGVEIVSGRGIGAAAARNDGIRVSKSDLVWCLDADCIAEPEALPGLLAGFDSDCVAAVGGSLGNACPNSLLANLVQDEISWRHARMPNKVNFLASGNVVYARQAFDAVGGFDENFQWAHDAELAYRFLRAGYELRFARQSIAVHHHFTNWWTYLTKQSLYAKNRILLYKRYPKNTQGDDYSSWVEHLRPPLALLILIFLAPTMVFPVLWILMGALILFLLLLSMATTTSVYKSRRRMRAVAFSAFVFLRAFARAIGACKGLLAVCTSHRRQSIPKALAEGRST